MRQHFTPPVLDLQLGELELDETPQEHLAATREVVERLEQIERRLATAEADAPRNYRIAWWTLFVAACTLGIAAISLWVTSQM